MFGSSSFGGFGQQNQQQQGMNNTAQPAAGSMFGQPATQNAFGTPATTFGQPAAASTPAFGAAQPNAFGAPAATAQPTQMGTPFSFNQASTTNTFGAPKPATTGFGSFGTGTAQPAGTSFGFGATSTPAPSQPTTGAFGGMASNPGFGQATTSSFGFGNAQAPGAQPTSTFGTFGAGGAQQTITQGSATVPYAPFREDMTPNEPKAHAKTFEVHQSIASMPAYQTMSPEELRWMDYQQGRGKGTAGPTTGATGTSTTTSFGFGQQPSAPTNNAFGQPATGTTNAFGQPAAPSTGLFGQQQQQQPGASTSMFGQAAQPSGGLFGNNAAKPTAFGTNNTTGTSMFGQPQQPSGGGLFGAGASAPSTTQPTSSFMFGQNNTTTNNNTAPGTTGFGFGAANNQAKPGGLFGNNAGTTGFGNNATTQPSSGFSFGTNTTQNQAGATGTTFGATTNNNNTGGFSFGTNNANQAKPAGGLFGATSTQPSTNTFGTNTSTTGGFSFGANNANQANNQAKPGGLFSSGGGTGFGATNTTTGTSTQPSTGFGAGATGGGLFGAKPAGTTGFGFGGANTATTGTQPSTGFGTGTALGTSTNTGGGLFGAKPAGTSLFGAGAGTNTGATQPGGATQPSNGGLFGQASNTSTNTGGGLFSASNAGKPAFSFGQSTTGAPNATQGTTGGTSLFGASQPAPGTGTSLFGASQSAPGAGTSLFGGAKPLGASAPAPGAAGPTMGPPSLTNNPYGTDALLANTSTVPTAATQAPLPFNVAPKNKPPLTSPFRSSPRNAVRVTRLRGSTPGLDLSRSVREGTPGDRATPVRAGSVGLFRPPSDAAALSPQAFIPRSTSKRLVLDGDTSLTQSPSAWRNGTPRASVPPRARFSPAVEKRVGGSAGGGASLGISASQPLEADTSSLSLPPPRDASFGSVPSSTPVAAGKAKAKSARVLQHGDYFTEPSLSELRAMPHETLSHVQDFVVGRVGFGRLAYLEPVDLTGMPDLSFVAGGVVQLRAKECFVYPQEEDLVSDTPLDGLLPNYVPVPKAPLGTGLNVPARVSLEGCWPLDRATREPLKDESLPRVKQHIHKLRNKKETEFLSYEAASGTWTFRVEHFSRYGLDESDEDMDDKEAMQSDSDDGPPLARLGESEEESDEDSSSSVMHESELVPGIDVDARDDVWVPTIRDAPPTLRRSMTPAVVSRRTPGVVEARKVQVMQASFFGQAPPTQGPVGGVSQDGPWASSVARDVYTLPPEVPERALDHVRVDDGEEEEEGEEEEIMVEDLPPRLPPVDVVRVPSAKSALDPSLPLDASLTLARSFRVGWCAPTRFVHSGVRPASSMPLACTQVQWEHIPMATREDDAASILAMSHRLLAQQLADSQIQREDGASAPHVTFAEGTTCARIAQMYDADDKQYAAQVWHLASALFDPLDLDLPATASSELRSAVTLRRRKAAFSQWLERSVTSSVQADVRAHVAASRRPEHVFALLTGHQVEQAAEAALEGGDVRLATLVAQAGGALEARADVHEQLALWHAEGVDDDIDRPRRRLYELLAGNVVHAEWTSARTHAREKQTMAMAAGLDWRRALGLHIWYGTAWESPLQACVHSYEEALKVAGETAPPLPSYQADAQLGILKQRALWQKKGAPRDALYELLKLYVDTTYPLAHVLDPRNFGQSAMDFVLPWHLYMYLTRALHARSLDEDVQGDQLTISYATQLESAGEWRWAAFVLLHLTDEDVRAKAVSTLLARHVEALNEEAVAYLTSTLHVDPRWIHLARAQAAHARHDLYVEYQCRLKAEDWARAHAVAVRYLAPEAFVRGETSLLLDLFRPMADAIEAGHVIPGWHEGGHVLLDYAMLPRLLPPLLAKAQDGTLSAQERHALQQATGRTHELLDRVPLLYADTTDLMSTVARTEMKAVLHNLSRLLASEAQAPEPPVHWSATSPPDAEQLQAAARDLSASMLACL